MASATTAAENIDEKGRPVTGGLETELTNKVEHAGAACMDKARELVSSVMEHAEDAASSVAHTVGDVGATIGAKDGALGTASSSVAKSLERGGHYLRHEGLGGMAKDITNLIRRNPVPALLIGVGIGFLLGKITARGFGHGK
jgi:hypothetical protein